MRLGRRLATLVQVLAILLFSIASARAAWVETQVKAHTAIVDVERSGVATVENEIVLGVRGGPLRDFEVQGVDQDAEPEGVATVTQSGRSGTASEIPLVVSRGDDGTLKLEIQNEKGLRTGTYTFAFKYRTNLLARDRIRRRGTTAELEWVSPRFTDGIDVAKVIFRLPDGPVAPTIPSGLEGDDTAVLGSAFLSAIRHEGGKVEVEVIRPHVARGEPAVWRVQTSLKCFDGLGSAASQPSNASARVISVEKPKERIGWIAGLLALALGYALLVVLKGSLHRRDCDRAGAEIAPLVRAPLGARAALAGAFLAASALLGALGDHPLPSAICMLLAIGFAALRPCKPRARPRGPGQWLVLTDADAFERPPEKTRGRFLDAGTLPGAVLLLVLLALVFAACTHIGLRSPYHSLALALSTAALLPIFGTGRRTSLPVDRARAPAGFLAGLARTLRRRQGVKAVAWARIPDGAREPDELRLLVRVPRARAGLSSIEVGVESRPSPAGYLFLPFVIVRVHVDSEAEAAYGRDVRWQRGRRMDEHIGIFRPVLPAAAQVLALLDELLNQATGAPSTSARKTRGAGASTAKVAVRSPAHAT